MARGCFASRVHFDTTSLAGGATSNLTPIQIIEGWRQGLQAFTAVHPQTGDYRVYVDGDRARAFCYGTALHLREHKSARDTR
jgi:hypothetical protein